MTTTILRDWAERIFWTFLAVFLTTWLAGNALSFDIDALKAAALAGATAAANLALLTVRQYVPGIPTPGAGLPPAAGPADTKTP